MLTALHLTSSAQELLTPEGFGKEMELGTWSDSWECKCHMNTIGCESGAMVHWDISCLRAAYGELAQICDTK